MDLIISSATSLRTLCLFGSKVMRDPTLSRRFLHRNLFGELGMALFTLADMVDRSATPGRMKCWEIFTNCISAITDPVHKFVHSESKSFSPAGTTNLPLILSAFLEHGIISRAMHALKYIKMNEWEFGGSDVDRLLEHILRDITPHMSVSRIARGATANLYPGLEDDVQNYDGWSMVVTSLPDAVSAAQLVFEERGGIHVDVCNNLKHSIRYESSHSEYSVRKCSSCECVAYCSRECQKADWDEGHKHECGLLRLGEGYKLISSILYEIRRDQLTFIEHLANERLPLIFPPDQSSASGKARTPDGVSLPESKPEAIIALLDATAPGIIRSNLHHPISTHADTIWRQINGVWDGRVQRLVKRAAERPERTVLVEAVFEHNHPAATYVLVEMRFDPEASRLTKLKVVNSVFRVGAVSLIRQLKLKEGSVGSDVGDHSADFDIGSDSE
ncbi:hypothetical protein DFP72DRAFT_922903 [Ephemerocybe angulata]|uniref:MYND-type domain-containing protein n=1 Tax=Ephemerocybe angulata TaxID=980116 RepID=A0A8H6HHN1_9AGAR|nr:hypothetical protein DFP72DRAFT_922903 [Tulosesus angulatus]